MYLYSVQPYQPLRYCAKESGFLWLAFVVPKLDLPCVMKLDSCIFSFPLISVKTEKTLYRDSNIEKLVDY